MEILIKENAADNYFRRCYKGTRPDAVGLHNEGFYNILKGLQGKWVEVETTHLFSNQFNTVPVEGVTGSGARINMEDVEEMYKNYNILNLCNMYVDGLNDDDETKGKLKEKLKILYTQCAYNNGGEIWE